MKFGPNLEKLWQKWQLPHIDTRIVYKLNTWHYNWLQGAEKETSKCTDPKHLNNYQKLVTLPIIQSHDLAKVMQLFPLGNCNTIFLSGEGFSQVMTQHGLKVH